MSDTEKESLQPTFNAVAQVDGNGCVQLTTTLTAPTKDGWIATFSDNWSLVNTPRAVKNIDLQRIELACWQTVGSAPILEAFTTIAASTSGKDYDKGIINPETKESLRALFNTVFSPYVIAAGDFGTHLRSIFESDQIGYTARNNFKVSKPGTP